MASGGDAWINIPRPKSGSTDAYNLLALDGGGVKGISSVVILQKIMERVREIENEAKTLKGLLTDPEERKPVDYFDLAGGTSTGGLIAVMLFRLEMKCSDAVAQYTSLSKMIFSPMLGTIHLDELGAFGKFIGDIWLQIKVLTGHAQYSYRPLEKGIDTVVGAFPLDEDDKAKKGDAVLVKRSQGQMFMCATLADRGESVLLRNYDPPFPALPVSAGVKDLNFNAITIKEAARATSAAPTYLKQTDIQGLVFWDGGLLNNNPIVQVWDTRDDLAPADTSLPRVTCIVSLGTSHTEYTATRRATTGLQRFLNTLTKTVAFVTNTEAKQRDFDRNIRQHNRRRPSEKIGYFRFNASTENEKINMDDYLKMPKLVEYTNAYLMRPEVDKKIQECAELLANVP